MLKGQIAAAILEKGPSAQTERFQKLLKAIQAHVVPKRDGRHFARVKKRAKPKRAMNKKKSF